MEAARHLRANAATVRKINDAFTIPCIIRFSVFVSRLTTVFTFSFQVETEEMASLVREVAI